MRTFTLRVSLLLLLTTGTAFALDEPGQDLPFLGRYPGSIIDSYKTAHYDEVIISLGILGQKGFTKSETVEGQVTYIRYKVPEDRSPLEFIRNYQQALQRAGFHVLWQCTDHGCRTPDADVAATLWRGAPTRYTGGAEIFNFENGRMLSAEHRATDGVRTIVFINDNTLFGHSQDASVYAVQTKPMQNGMISGDTGPLTRESMAGALIQQGRFAMHLPFDFKQATLRPDAQPTLTALSQLMEQHPSLRIRLEGHTDQVGSAIYNRKLSLSRALAVKSALIAHGIVEQRIEVTGLGATRPIAGNDTDAGRAQNRRVEVVDLSPGNIARLRPTNTAITPTTTQVPTMNSTPITE
ncbi:OmpA family protein [Acidithiobacillus sp.]|uniref:OmpA family protein n=1 Tax=Acidithiobacillus sp. TaxID=1872118 RepID=UPI002318E028|nr:OmpA family protein [Acidithiobacillus sp.]MDA8245223.1 OmpA family protein [Acidithiobacillus sp.]